MVWAPYIVNKPMGDIRSSMPCKPNLYLYLANADAAPWNSLQVKQRNASSLLSTPVPHSAAVCFWFESFFWWSHAVTFLLFLFSSLPSPLFFSFFLLSFFFSGVYDRTIQGGCSRRALEDVSAIQRKSGEERNNVRLPRLAVSCTSCMWAPYFPRSTRGTGK